MKLSVYVLSFKSITAQITAHGYFQFLATWFARKILNVRSIIGCRSVHYKLFYFHLKLFKYNKYIMAMIIKYRLSKLEYQYQYDNIDAHAAFNPSWPLGPSPMPMSVCNKLRSTKTQICTASCTCKIWSLDSWQHFISINS